MRKLRHPGIANTWISFSNYACFVLRALTILHCASFLVLSIVLVSAPWALMAQQDSTAHPTRASIRGVVLAPDRKPAAGVAICLETPDATLVSETRSNDLGRFSFSGVAPASYRVIAQQGELRSEPAELSISASGEEKELKLILTDHRSSTSPSSSDGMEFSDTPSFTIAAVTDWTAAGGHGSDTILRTSEALAHETLTLKPSLHESPNPSSAASTHTAAELRAALAKAPADFSANHELGDLYLREGKHREAIPLLLAAYRANPADRTNEYDLAQAFHANGNSAEALQHVQSLLARHRTGDLLRVQGTLQEELGRPLDAVQSFEQATREEASEENYFAWGSELLLHRAILQARDVLSAGAKRFPSSPRLATSLGAALFACALYDEAAVQLCRAADLDPASPDPYEFLGKADLASPNPLPCAEPKLAAFTKRQPDNARILYYHAMALWKQNGVSGSPQVTQQVQSSLQRAVTLDPHFGEAYLQLGNLQASMRAIPQAVEFYNRAIAADPDLGEAHYRLGLAYDRLGDREAARREFQLHEEITRRQKAETERQRREIKQFLVVDSKPTAPATH